MLTAKTSTPVHAKIKTAYYSSTFSIHIAHYTLYYTLYYVYKLRMIMVQYCYSASMFRLAPYCMHTGSYLRTDRFCTKLSIGPPTCTLLITSYKSSIYSYTPRFLELTYSNQFVKLKIENFILCKLLQYYCSHTQIYRRQNKVKINSPQSLS